MRDPHLILPLAARAGASYRDERWEWAEVSAGGEWVYAAVRVLFLSDTAIGGGFQDPVGWGLRVLRGLGSSHHNGLPYLCDGFVVSTGCLGVGSWGGRGFCAGWMDAAERMR